MGRGNEEKGRYGKTCKKRNKQDIKICTRKKIHYTQINTISIQMKQRKTKPMQTDRICMYTTLTDFIVMLSPYNYRQKVKAYLYRIRVEV